MRGELLFERHFLDQGILIAAPRYDIHCIDFIIDWEGELRTVQVKTMTKFSSISENIRYAATIKKANKVKYQKGDFDFYGLVNLDYDKIWLVPFDVLGQQTLVTWMPVRFQALRCDAVDINPYLIN